MALDPRLMSKSQAQDAHVDVGLRQYMLGVYNHMTIGLAITGLVALGAVSYTHLTLPTKA